MRESEARSTVRHMDDQTRSDIQTLERNLQALSAAVRQIADALAQSTDGGLQVAGINARMKVPY